MFFIAILIVVFEVLGVPLPTAASMAWAQDSPSPRAASLAKDPIMANIRASRQIRLATDPTSPPFNALGLDGYKGLEVDLAAVIGQELSKAIGAPITVKWVPLRYDDIKPSVRSGHAHVGFNCLSQEENLKEGDWGVYTQGYLDSSLAIIHPVSAGPQTLKTLKASKKAIGTLNDASNIKWLKENGLNYLSFGNDAKLFEALETGKVNFLMYDYPILVAYVQSQQGRFVFIKEKYAGEPYKCAGLIKGEGQELVAVFNKAIEVWLAQPGTQEALKPYAYLPETHKEGRGE